MKKTVQLKDFAKDQLINRNIVKHCVKQQSFKIFAKKLVYCKILKLYLFRKKYIFTKNI